MIPLKLIYIANIMVAGWISISSIFFSKTAVTSVFSNAYSHSEVIKLVGCLWGAIAILSILGMWRPLTFSPLLLLQLIYKGGWLLLVALPAIKNNTPYPSGMAGFFLVWCLILPFVIPWTEWVK